MSRWFLGLLNGVWKVGWDDDIVARVMGSLGNGVGG